MKTLVAGTIFLFFFSSLAGQDTGIRAMADSLRYIKSDTLDCRAGLNNKQTTIQGCHDGMVRKKQNEI